LEKLRDTEVVIRLNLKMSHVQLLHVLLEHLSVPVHVAYIAICEYREVPGEEEATNRNIQFFFMYYSYTLYSYNQYTLTNSLDTIQFQQLLKPYIFGTGVPTSGSYRTKQYKVLSSGSYRTK